VVTAMGRHAKNATMLGCKLQEKGQLLLDALKNV
jgi:hypothetical protein